MDLSAVKDLASLAFTGLQTLFTGVNTGVNVYLASHNKKVERLCNEVEKSGIDVSTIVNDEANMGYFFSVVDRFRREANMDKLAEWKNAMVHLITDFHDFDYKDNLLSILESVTAFDLTVLSEFYLINQHSQDDYLLQIYELFGGKGVPEHMVTHSIKRLAGQNLITELAQPGMILGTLAQPAKHRFAMNDLGRDFLRFVSEYNG